MNCFRRFDPSYAAIRERVKQGEVGKVLSVKVCSRDSPLPSLAYLEISGKSIAVCFEINWSDSSIVSFRRDIPRLRRARHRPGDLHPGRVSHQSVNHRPRQHPGDRRHRRRRHRGHRPVFRQRRSRYHRSQ